MQMSKYERWRKLAKCLTVSRRYWSIKSFLCHVGINVKKKETFCEKRELPLEEEGRSNWKSTTYDIHSWNTWHDCIKAKEEPKIYESHDNFLKFCFNIFYSIFRCLAFQSDRVSYIESFNIVISGIWCISIKQWELDHFFDCPVNL